MPLRARIRERLTVTPEQYTKVAWISLVVLSLIVLTGAGVRLTGSGLGCADWPRCTTGHVYPPFQTHALIEFGNRVAGALVGVMCAVAVILAWTRRPYRRDLFRISWLLPLGVLAQAVLGGVTVRQRLAPGWVMAHFSLSMLIIIAAVALVWRARHEPGSRPRSTDRISVWSVRALAPLGALTIVAGTAATAAGPHSGGASGQHIARLTFKGKDTLQWVVNQHATIGALFGCAVIAVWFLRRRRGASPDQLELLVTVGVLLAGQGLVGAVQYELKLPTDMVWVHVGLATTTWVALLWAVCSAGRLAPRTAPALTEPPHAAPRTFESVGALSIHDDGG
ncbi:MAG TPA: COX15/CtaA family protein [Solirubrobacteraceae bacterium]|nr:COX15/CtaA family protein [Solirubrobacteraceae bacterium]